VFWKLVIVCFVVVKLFRNWVCDGLQIVVGIKVARSGKMDSVQNTKPAVMYHHHFSLYFHQISLEK